MKNNQPQHKIGFTLIESTVAILILIVGLLAVIQFFPFALKIIGNSQRTTIASNVALSKLEETITQPYDTINVGTIEPKQRVSTDQSSYLYHYQRQTVVTYLDSNLNPALSDSGLKRINVTVYWNSPFSLAEKTIELQSVVSDY